MQFFDVVQITPGLIQPDFDVLRGLAPHDLPIRYYVLPDGLRSVAAVANGADPIYAVQDCVGYLTQQLPGGAMAMKSRGERPGAAGPGA
jgi:hypothetical protein